MSYKHDKPYFGALYPHFGANAYTFSQGKTAGVKAIDVKTGGGLEFTALEGKALDIAYLSYKGTNISFLSKTGIVAAPYYHDDGGVNSFLQGFHGGMLTTCGLTQSGAPCQDEGNAVASRWHS